MKLKLGTMEGLFFLAWISSLGVLIAGSTALAYVANDYLGVWGSVGVGVFALFTLFFGIMRYFYRFAEMLDVRSRAEAREKYRSVYRVLSLPSTGDFKPYNWCAADVTVGDFGWECRPITKDGLIWLHGLSVDWGHVWRVGFRPDEIECVGPKPVSQFDWKDFEYDGPKPTACYHWEFAKPKHPCPFPVQKTITDRRLKFPIECV